MAKRNYGTVQRTITSLTDDLTSRGPNGIHNQVYPDQLMPLFDAILTRMPRSNAEFVFSLIDKVSGIVTVGMVHELEKKDKRLHDAYIELMAALAAHTKKKEEPTNDK